MRRSGWHVDTIRQDIYHFPDEMLTEIIDNGRYDLVGLGFVAGYYQYRKALSISRAVNECVTRDRFKYVLGGHGPAGAPEYFMDQCGADHVVVGFGEGLAKPLLGPIVNGDTHYPEILPDFAFPEMFTYRLHRFPNSAPTDFTVPILSGRGCPYSCTFCFRMIDGFFPRPVEEVMEEIRMLNATIGATHIQFADELLMSSKARSVEFAEAIVDLPFKIKWDCNGRLNHAAPEVLGVMKRSGCNYINYGVEALSDEVLAKMKKKLTVETIHAGVKATIDAGITPGLNLMWGNIGDDEDTLQAAMQFLIKYDGVSELRTIRPVTPYPGCELFDTAVERGLIDDESDFYENKHTNSDLFTVSFMDEITAKDANMLLAKANERLLSAYYMRCAVASTARARAFYEGRDTDFRGWRAV
jgi:radical SAM superfamily enzyme YgiQ (UPF0313 family)